MVLRGWPREVQRGLILIAVASLLAGLALVAAPRTAFAAGVVGTGTPGSCTDAALGTALAGGGLVTFNCGPSSKTIHVSEHIISADTTIQGNLDGSGNLLIGLNADDLHRHFRVDNGVTLTINDIRLVGGSVGDGVGGSIDNEGGAVNLSNVRILATSTGANAQNGGAIYSVGGSVTLTNNSVLYFCEAAQFGGNLYAEDTAVTITDSFLDSGLAESGGNVYMTAGSLDLTGGQVIYGAAENALDSAGGGLALFNVSDASVNGTAFLVNYADVSGGGIYAYQSTLDIDGANFGFALSAFPVGNETAGDGGAIYAEGGTLTVENSFFDSSFADGHGGALYTSADTTLTDVAITYSGASEQGAGIAAYGPLTLTRVLLDIGCGCAGDGGGLYYDAATSTASITDSTIQNFPVGGNGGGIYVANGTLNLTGSTLSNNAAAIGGGIYDASLQGVAVRNSTISNNESDTVGGGIASVLGTPLTLNNDTVASNRAAAGGGIAVVDLGPASPAIDISNTILAHNVATADVSADCAATLNSLGYNLIRKPDGCTLTGDLTGNILGVGAGIGQLADNGGSTETRMPNQGSRVINAGNPNSGPGACESTDQRGEARPSAPGTVCDIGAVELQDDVAPTTNKTVTPAANLAAWNKGNVTIHLDATDAGGVLDPASGVKSITFSATGEQPISPTTIPGSTTDVLINTTGATGMTTVSYFATDFAGNVEATQTVAIKLDKILPTTNGSPTIHMRQNFPIRDLPGLTNAVSVTVDGWSGSDTPSGLDRFWLSSNTDGGAFTHRGLPSPTATQAHSNLAADATYQYQVRAFDVAGNRSAVPQTGPKAHLGLVHDDDGAISYTGSWQTSSDPAWLNDEAHASRTNGDMLSYSFQGTSIAVVAPRGNNRGIASIAVDGGTPVDVDLYSANRQPKMLVLVVENLTDGIDHTITITVTGQQNLQSNGAWVYVDGFVVQTPVH